MDNYKIEKAYPWAKNSNEITILSENLIYTEMGNHMGVQCNVLGNSDLVREKCNQIAGLIREVDLLIKPNENHT